METTTIEIDFDVHKRIEMERKGFSETPNQVLRRLLSIGEPERLQITPKLDGGGRPWIGKGRSAGLELPHGTELEYHYNDQHFKGRVADGQLVVEGQAFSSPSGAAVALCRTKDGEPTNLNGKAICHIRLPGAKNFVQLLEYERQQKRK